MPPLVSDPGVFVVHLVGASDSHAAGRVQRDLWAALGHGGPVVVDLSGATALGAACLALLVETIATCEDAGRSCVLLVPDTCPAAVRDRFGRDSLGALLPVSRTWDDALRRAAARPASPRALPGAQEGAPGWTMPVS